MPEFGRGLIYTPPDPRTFPFDAGHYNAPAAEALPAGMDLRGGANPTRERPVGSPGCQYMGASCVAFALTRLRAALRVAAGAPFVPYSPAFTWYEGRALEGTQGQNAGMAVADGWKTLMLNGACAESLDPYDWTQWAVPPTTAQIDAARPFKVASWHGINSDVEACQAIAAKSPVAITIRAYEAFEQTGPDGILSQAALSETRDPNHEVLVAGYDSYWMYGVNWWHDPAQGYVWGQQGYFYFPRAAWGSFVAAASTGSLKAVA